VDGLFM
jgi:hypothetical protein